MSDATRPAKLFRWTMRINCIGTTPPMIEISTGTSRDRNAAIRAALRGRILQLKALRSETGTSVLTLDLLLPGQIKETMKWRLTHANVENLILQAYPPPRSRRSQSTSSATPVSSTESPSPSTPTTPAE